MFTPNGLRKKVIFRGALNVENHVKGSCRFRVDGVNFASSPWQLTALTFGLVFSSSFLLAVRSVLFASFGILLAVLLATFEILLATFAAFGVLLAATFGGFAAFLSLAVVLLLAFCVVPLHVPALQPGDTI